MAKITRRHLIEAGVAAGAAAALGAQRAVAAGKSIRAAWVGWGDRQVLPVVNAAKAMAPQINVAVETIPVAQYFQTLEVRLAPRNGAPDFFLVDGPLTASYAVRGHIRDLTPNIQKEKFSLAALKQATYDGKLYSAPFATSSQLLYFNKALLKKAGIEFPSVSVDQRWSWEKLVDAAKKVTNLSAGIWGFSFEQADRPYQLFPLVQSLEGKLISDDGLQSEGYVNSAEAVEGFNFYQRLFHDWKISPPGLFDGPLVQELFASGNLAFMVGGTYIMDNLKNKQQLDWGVAPHPYFASGRPVTPTGSWHLAVNAKSQNADAALEFLSGVLSPEVMKVWFQVRPFPPVLSDLWTQDQAPFNSDGWKIVGYELDHTAEVRPQTPGYAEYEDTLKVAIRDIQAGAAIPAVLTSASEKIDIALRKYRS